MLVNSSLCYERLELLEEPGDRTRSPAMEPLPTPPFTALFHSGFRNVAEPRESVWRQPCADWYANVWRGLVLNDGHVRGVRSTLVDWARTRHLPAAAAAVIMNNGSN